MAPGRAAAPWLLALLLVVPAVPASQAPAPEAAAPRLLVLIAVDQFRADYPAWYGRSWTGGLHRLFTRGAVFARAVTPWAITRTCNGHASIGTGALPSTHGVIANEWYDRQQRALITCTSDPAVTPVGFAGARATEQHSARWLQAPTLAEELRRQAAVPPRVVSIALKARAAIGLEGHGGNGTVVVWEEDSGTWATSSAYASAPWPVVETFLSAHSPTAAQGSLWQRLLPPSQYLFEDRATGEPAAGEFPHRLVAPHGVPFSAVWDMSPWSDAYVADFAAAMVDRAGLGQRDATDLLTIGFSALDYAGHAFGPRSHEVQDVLARLDQSLATLFEALDRSVGANRYVVGFTSDHGVALLPEQALAVAGRAGGRLNPGSIAAAIDGTLRARLGRRSFIEAVTSSDIYLGSGIVDAMDREPGLATEVITAAEAVMGVDRVFWTARLAESGGADPVREAARASFYPGRSGDLVFLPKPYWVVSSSGTHHGSAQAYDREVPVVFFGQGIVPGQYAGATPIDVAPTLAALAGITMPRADGAVRREVLVP